MKKITLLALFVTLVTMSTFVNASNWIYNNVTAKWEKDITPSMLQFNNLSTAQVQSNIIAALGGANPNPAITTTTGQDLSNGYFAVTGGQVGSTTDPTLTNLRNGFNIMNETLGDVVHNVLRFASSTSTITTGTKCGLGGYFNLNWYVPAKYNYSAYNVSFRDSVYNPGTFNLQLLVYGEAGTQLGTTQNLNTAGWHVASFTQTDTRPFRIKMSIPNTAALIAYYKTPELLLVSNSEPTTRTISVNKVGNGTVTATYATVRDQDVQVFVFEPSVGETLNSVSYNEEPVTPVDNGNGTYSYTTPLLTADGSLTATFSGVSTDLSNNNLSELKLYVHGGKLHIAGLSAGEKIEVYALNGSLIYKNSATAMVESIALSQGVYFVKAGIKVSKIVL